MPDFSEEFPSNSHSSKDGTPAPERKKLTRVTAEPVVKRKPSMLKKMKETFVGEDATSVGTYVLFEVILPRVKDLLFDAATQGLERKLFGDARGRLRPTAGTNPVKTSYQKMYNGAPKPEPRTTERYDLTPRQTAEGGPEDIVLASRGDAQAVLDDLNTHLLEYGDVSVADLYDLVGITGAWTDNRRGWTDLRGAGATLVRGGGYRLNLPRIMALD